MTITAADLTAFVGLLLLVWIVGWALDTFTRVVIPRELRIGLPLVLLLLFGLAIIVYVRDLP